MSLLCLCDVFRALNNSLLIVAFEKAGLFLSMEM